MGRLNPEKVRTRAAPSQLFGRRSPHILNLHVQANRNSGQRMVAIQHHMLRVNIGHREQRVERHIGVAALGERRPLDLGTDFQLRREQAARLQELQLVVKVAKGLVGLYLNLQCVACTVTVQDGLNRRQQIATA